MQLSDEQREQYWSKGWVVVESVIERASAFAHRHSRDRKLV